jgi:hypothetical protein
MKAELMPDVFVASAVQMQAHDIERFKIATAPPDDDPRDALWSALVANHHHNCHLWHEEDLVRRTDVPDALIVAGKRAIDGHNQARNNAVERLDEALLARLPPLSEADPAHSETPGAMLDRLSILALKVHHMALQTQRLDTGEAHRQLCEARLLCLRQQRTDLANCLRELLAGIQCGQVRFRVYRQFKMYNDPAYRAS